MPQPAISRIDAAECPRASDTLERLLRACDQELEPVAVAGDRDLDWGQIDDHLDMSPTERARNATSSGRSMMGFVDAARQGPAVVDRPFDPPAALHGLAAGAVTVVIGGFAAALRGSPVITDDLDICYAQGSTNRRQLSDALIALGARVRGEWWAPFEIEDALEVGDRCSFETNAGTVDTIATPRATRGYADLVVGADRLDIGGMLRPGAVAGRSGADEGGRPSPGGFVRAPLPASGTQAAGGRVALNARLRGPGGACWMTP